MKLSVNGTNYHYEIYGQGPPLVLFHGFTGSTETWHPFIEKWQGTFQLVMIDLPGHGETRAKSSISMDQCCNDLEKLLSHLNLDIVHILGYSMGGRTALSFAMMFPEKVQSLILVSASPGLETKEERRERIERDEKLAEWIKQKGIHAFVDYWESISLFKSQKILSKDKQQVIRQERLAQSPTGLAASLRGMGTGAQPSLWGTLNNFKKPVLLLVGEWDIKFIEINRKMHDLFLDSQLKTISQTGHAIHVEQPESFVKIVKEFILNQQNETTI